MPTEDGAQGRDAAADAGVYEIRVRVNLSPRARRWLGDLEIVIERDGESLLRGAMPDQAALYGLLDRLRDLGVALVSLARVEPPTPPTAPAPPTPDKARG